MITIILNFDKIGSAFFIFDKVLLTKIYPKLDWKWFYTFYFL